MKYILDKKISFRPAYAEKLIKNFGSKTKVAYFYGIHPGRIGKMLDGEMVDARVIATTLTAFETTFEEAFELTSIDSQKGLSRNATHI